MSRPMSFEAFSREATLKVAHDSGDGVTIYHCPFDGSGQVIARSDNSVECQFCGVCFSVQVQPQFSAFPQTIDGQPVQVPGIPGSGVPDGPPQQAFGDEQDETGGGPDGGTVPDPQGEDDDEGDEDEGDMAGGGAPPFGASA